MRSWKPWFVVVAVLAGCSDKNGGLPGPSEPGPDGAVDITLAVEDTSAVAEETGGRLDGANATGGVVGSGGVVGTGGAVGTGGRGAIDAATATDGAGPVASGGQVSGTGSSGGSGGVAGTTTTTMIGTGGGTGGSIGSGGAGQGGGPGVDGGALSLLDVVPRSNSIAGWTIDPSNPVTAARVAAVATTQSEAEALIDGAASDFFAGPAVPTMFAWQNYVNAGLPSPGSEPGGSALSLYMLQLPSAEQAINLYLSLRQSALYARNTWTEPTSPPIGARSRITDSGSDWWIDFCKGNYYVEVRMTPSYGPPPDYAISDASQKKAAMDFAAAVAAKM